MHIHTVYTLSIIWAYSGLLPKTWSKHCRQWISTKNAYNALKYCHNVNNISFLWMFMYFFKAHTIFCRVFNLNVCFTCFGPDGQTLSLKLFELLTELWRDKRTWTSLICYWHSSKISVHGMHSMLRSIVCKILTMFLEWILTSHGQWSVYTLFACTYTHVMTCQDFTSKSLLISNHLKHFCTFIL